MKDFDGQMKLSQLKMFVAVADSGSFSAAAAQLDCTQSRISHAIGELERELGVRLLERARDGSVPTDTGHRVLEQARQMLRLEASLAEVARDGRELAGQVRIACFRSIGTHLLPHVVEALAREYPGIRVDIDDSCEERTQVTDALHARRAEIGIAQLPVSDEFVSYPWVHDHYRMVVPAGAVPRGHGIPTLPFIGLACSGAADILARYRAAGFDVEPERLLANDTSIAAMVGRGMGYSILPELSIYPTPDDVAVLPLPIASRREFAIAGLPDTMRAPAVKAVVRFLRDKRILSRTRAHLGGITAWS